VKGVGDLSYGVHKILAFDLIDQVGLPDPAEPPCENPMIAEVAGEDVEDPVGTPLNKAITQDHDGPNVVLLNTAGSLHVEAGNCPLVGRCVHLSALRLIGNKGFELLWNGDFLGIG